MANRVQYQIVGRYMDGKEVTGYHLQSMETGKSGMYTREQVILLVGRDQVTNCSAQIYQDKVLLRGVGMSLEDLPVQQSNGTFKATESIGKVKRGTSSANAMEQWLLVGKLKTGTKTVGYIVQNAGCGTKRISRADLEKLAVAGKLGNVTTQQYNGKTLFRGVGMSLDDLPVTQVE